MRKHPERWSIVPHRNDDPPDRKLAIAVVEHTLPARYLGFGEDGPLPFDEFPLTASWVRRVMLVLGLGWPGEKHAREIARQARALLVASSYWPRDQEHNGLTLYKLRPLAQAKPAADTGEILLSAKEICQGQTREIFGERGPP